MDATKIISSSLEMSDALVKRALDGLDEEDLVARPGAQDNPIGWLMWHKTRAEDTAIANVAGSPQLWISDRWHEKFGMDANPQQIGFSDSPEQVRQLKFVKENLVGYAAAVRARTLSILQTLSPDDLEKEIPDILGGGAIKTGAYLGRMSVDNLQHGGQICYLRGFITGFGWLLF